jgi:hypothetical protein
LKLLRPLIRPFRPGNGLSLLWLSLGLACGRQNETAALRALAPAGDVSILCLGSAPDGTISRGLDRNECPDFAHQPGSPEQRHTMALVTQPKSGEVAAIDIGVSPNQVIDFEPTQPGYSFLPVGAEPTSIVSTPGGVASFVAVRETGREGIFALPSSCVWTRPKYGALRDLRTWPACRLPSAPGLMVLLTDPARDDDGDPATPDRVRERCTASYVAPDELIGAAPAASREQCPADLATEGWPFGRRKIAVTLPGLSEIWILDAQELLDRAPGSFADCIPEASVALTASTADQSERLPADLQPSSASCLPVGFDPGPTAAEVRPWPVDLALDEDARLYIADSQAPVIHRLDASDPCNLATLPPLYPLSYSDPKAVITTRKVAVSPLTASGKRFVYAVDNSTTPTAGSLIPFDVSPGATDRTPIVRERATYTPGEAPDRIQLPRDVADVEFVFQDNAIAAPDTGIAVEGIACDPNPLNVPLDSPAARYRPTPDRASGALPNQLRGTFAFAAMHSGQIAVIDVEDLDGACRRPYTTHTASSEDLYGCRNDDPTVPGGVYLSSNAVPTVSNELSCNVVVPHRARSRNFFSNASAGLLSFPSLSLPTGRSVLTDQSSAGKDQPKLLGARYYPRDPEEQETLNVGALSYGTESPGLHLDLDPATTKQSSVLLSYNEPRAYISGEDFSVIYEGVIRGESQARFLAPEGEASFGIVSEGLNATFCGSGVQDLDLTADVGRSLGVTDPAKLALFARDHADYVQITGPLLPVDDGYWRSGNPGAECGAELFQDSADSVDSARELRGRALCEQFFGPPQVPTQYRDLRILAASEDQLAVEPRLTELASATRRQKLMQLVSCCFPEPTNFVVRVGNQWSVRGGASGAPHHVKTDPVTSRCVNDCNPLTQRLNSRVFEITCSGKCSPRDELDHGPAGRAGPRDFACVVDDTTEGIDPNEPGSECVYQSLTTRFAIYRGQQPTARDTSFRWVLSDGFTPFTLSLNSGDRATSTPHSMLALPELGALLVTDSTAPGLTTIAIRSLNFVIVSVY